MRRLRCFLFGHDVRSTTEVLMVGAVRFSWVTAKCSRCKRAVTSRARVTA